MCLEALREGLHAAFPSLSSIKGKHRAKGMENMGYLGSRSITSTVETSIFFGVCTTLQELHVDNRSSLNAFVRQKEKSSLRVTPSNF